MVDVLQDHKIEDDGDVFTQLTKHKTEKPDLSKLRGKRVHNVSLGLLDSYFHLGAFLQNGKAYVYKDRGIVMRGHQGTCKTFLYESNPADLEDIKRLQNMSHIYTIKEFNGLPKKGSFMETLYDLDDVFDGTSYENAKKRYQRIVYPSKWLKSHNVRFFSLGPEHDEEIELLHSKWRDYKMNQPATFRMMFPSKRYLHCAHLLTRPKLNVLNLNYRGWGWRDPHTDELWGVRVMYIEDDTAYDLAFFCNQWSAPSQLSNNVNFGLMDILRQEGLKYLNCGSNTASKGLKDYKHHYPFIDYKSFHYSSLTGAMKAKKD
jgi:hypothetical protein